MIFLVQCIVFTMCFSCIRGPTWFIFLWLQPMCAESAVKQQVTHPEIPLRCVLKFHSIPILLRILWFHIAGISAQWSAEYQQHGAKCPRWCQRVDDYGELNGTKWEDFDDSSDNLVRFSARPNETKYFRRARDELGIRVVESVLKAVWCLWTKLINFIHRQMVGKKNLTKVTENKI